MATKKKSKVTKQTAVNVPAPLSFSAIPVLQSGTTLYMFKQKASKLFACISINRRVEDKDEGYQRALSQSRIESIKRYIKGGHVIPGAIIISFDEATYNSAKSELVVPAGTDVGWVIDGQHRLAGARLAAIDGTDIEMPVVAFVGLTEVKQIEQFVVINREAKNVPTSLYLDLIGKLVHTKPGDFAKERAVDIGTELRRDEESPFYERIAVTTSPRDGQISLTNFVRKIAPHVTPDKGLLHIYTELEQRAVVGNYFKALRSVFPGEFDSKGSLFFKTVGFGALWNAFGTVFSLALTKQSGFQVKDVIEILKPVENFDFGAWREYGSGNLAEVTAGDDFKASLLLAHSDAKLGSGALRV
jgi:DGQHR domain-containing protein